MRVRVAENALEYYDSYRDPYHRPYNAFRKSFQRRHRIPPIPPARQIPQRSEQSNQNEAVQHETRHTDSRAGGCLRARMQKLV